MKPPTLIDQLYKLSFKPEPVIEWQSNVEMRRALEGARRFVADERMSAFMAELANEAFIRSMGATDDGRRILVRSQLCNRIADSLRVQSRLPHDSIWIEYDLHAYQRRSNEIRQTPPSEADASIRGAPFREGWLIQQHSKIDTACIVHIFTWSNEQGLELWTFPFAFAWCCDDSPLPWQLSVPGFVSKNGRDVHSSEILVGLVDYCRDNVGIVKSPLIKDPLGGDKKITKIYSQLMHEWTGTVRRMWALLATIDNLPLTVGNVRQQKGFLARGRIRKFLDHSTITLNIPAKKDTRVIARRAIAVVHRKRHEVRAFWRKDWRQPPSSRCNPHIWQAIDEEANHIQCDLCGGRQIYVHKHERGDASLGYTTHDYILRHEVKNA